MGEWGDKWYTEIYEILSPKSPTEINPRKPQNPENLREPEIT